MILMAVMYINPFDIFQFDSFDSIAYLNAQFKLFLRSVPLPHGVPFGLQMAGEFRCGPGGVGRRQNRLQLHTADIPKT